MPDGGLGEGGRAACESYWTVFTDPQGVTYNPCNDKAIYDDPKAFDGNEVKYPISKCPFKGGGLTGCVFSQASSTDVGSMACGGAVGACVKNTSGRKGCDGGDDTWRLWRSAPSYRGSVSGDDSMLSLRFLFSTDVLSDNYTGDYTICHGQRKSPCFQMAIL